MLLSLAFAGVALAAMALGAVGLFIADQAIGRGGRFAAGERAALGIGLAIVASAVAVLTIAAPHFL